MAKRRPHFTPSIRRAMDAVFDPETTSAKSEGIKEVFEGAQHLRDLYNEIDSVGEFQRRNGFLGNRSMQHVCKIHTSHMIAIEQFHELGCDCGQQVFGAGGHKEWIYHWLAGPGKPLDVRSKTVV